MSARLLRLIPALALAAGSLTVLTSPAQAANEKAGQQDVCDVAEPGHASCYARVVTHGKPGGGGTPPVKNTVPVGLTPLQMHSAYTLPATAATPVTIAVIGAFESPSVQADLDAYDTQFGLGAFPTCSATVTTACFQKVAQDGTTRYPRSQNSSWALEADLDVQTTHAVCPNCKILLVEATTNSYANLFAAVDRAVAMGAKVVSMSFGGAEFSTQSSYNSHFTAPGVAFTASTGDSGAATHYPAASPNVTAVGGTTLTLDSAGSWVSETVWSGTGGGCSVYETKPSWQTDTGCAHRTIADVAAVADPATGAAIYTSGVYSNQTGWLQVGGTSLAAPLVGGIYALAGVPSGPPAALAYAQAANLHDVVSGSNGTCAGYLCNAGIGYDSPTGLGTPNGLAAF